MQTDARICTHASSYATTYTACRWTFAGAQGNNSVEACFARDEWQVLARRGSQHSTNLFQGINSSSRGCRNLKPTAAKLL